MSNDITILSCPQCGFPRIRDCGNGLYQCDICETYFDKDENIVLTEQEWLQTCDTEQLAEVLARYVCGWTTNYSSYDMALHSFSEWLKQPHTTE